MKKNYGLYFYEEMNFVLKSKRRRSLQSEEDEKSRSACVEGERRRGPLQIPQQADGAVSKGKWQTWQKVRLQEDTQGRRGLNYLCMECCLYFLNDKVMKAFT